jgi:predicted Zn finger-like uncharacterized protein
MILVCPSCKASYLVPASLFARGGRKVRCARCGQDWFYDLPSRLTVLPSTTPTETAEPPPRSPVPPLASPKNLPALWKSPKDKLLKIAKIVALLLAVASFAGLVALTAKPILRLVASMTSSAAPSKSTAPSPGFSMHHVKSERRFQDGSMQLVVEGDLRYDGKGGAPVPAIRAAALGPDGRAIKEWTIPPPKATLNDKESQPFASAVNTPEGTVVEINLSFEPVPPPP